MIVINLLHRLAVAADLWHFLFGTTFLLYVLKNFCFLCLQDSNHPLVYHVQISFNYFYNIPRAWLLNRSPVPAMVLQSNRSGLLMV